MIAARTLAAALLLPLAGGASAQSTPGGISGDLPAFRACVGEMLHDNPAHFAAAYLVPTICGTDFVPIRQSCLWAEYLPLERRETCEQHDLAFWQAQLAELEATALAAGRGGTSGPFAAGLERCNDGDDNDRRACLSELYWREALGFLAAPILEELTFAAAPQVGPAQVVQVYHACLTYEDAPRSCAAYAQEICQLSGADLCQDILQGAMRDATARISASLPDRLPEGHPDAARFADWRARGPSDMSVPACGELTSEACGAATAADMASRAGLWIAPMLELPAPAPQPAALTMPLALPLLQQCLNQPGRAVGDCTGMAVQMCAGNRGCHIALSDALDGWVLDLLGGWPQDLPLPDPDDSQPCPPLLVGLDLCILFDSATYLAQLREALNL